MADVELQAFRHTCGRKLELHCLFPAAFFRGPSLLFRLRNLQRAMALQSQLGSTGVSFVFI